MEQHENMKLVDRIILNGIVSNVPTEDDNKSTIGVLRIIKQTTFKGEVLEVSTGFPLTKRMGELWGHNYASVRFVTGDCPIDPTMVDEKTIQSYFGLVKNCYYTSEYTDYHGNSETEEYFKVDKYDIKALLENLKGKYIHMEIEIFKRRKGL